MERPFEPGDVPVQVAVSPPTSPGGRSALTIPLTPSAVGDDEDPWKAEFEAQVSELQAQSPQALETAERERAKWEEIRKHEEEEREAIGQEPETWDTLGSHVTSSMAVVSEFLAGHTPTSEGPPSPIQVNVSSIDGAMPSTDHGSVSEHHSVESVSPSQKWVQISPSLGSSYPSISLSDPSGLSSSPAPRPSPPPSCSPTQRHKSSVEERNTAIPPSTLPSIMDHTVTRRTRFSLIVSSLAINLFLPFVNGVMLGFGEIFAKNVLVGWFGWRTQSGRIAAHLGVRR